MIPESGGLTHHHTCPSAQQEDSRGRTAPMPVFLKVIFGTFFTLLVRMQNQEPIIGVRGRVRHGIDVRVERGMSRLHGGRETTVPPGQQVLNQFIWARAILGADMSPSANADLFF